MTSVDQSLGELVESIFSGRAATRLKPGSDELAIVNMRDVGTVVAPREQLEVARKVSIRDANRVLLREGDVVVTNRGSVRAAVVGPENVDDGAGANTVVVRLRPGIPSNVIAAFLRHPRTAGLLMREFSGSTTAGFSVEGLKSLRISLPDTEALAALSAMVDAAERYYAACLIAAESRRDLAFQLIMQNLSPIETDEHHA